MINPPAGTYDEPIHVSFEENSHYSLNGPIYQNSWHTLATAPLPLRSRAGLLGNNLLGGDANGVPLFLNDRYDPATDTWTIDTDMPAAGYPICSGKNVVCDKWTALWDGASFHVKNPVPRSVNQSSFQDNILLNGEESVYSYDEKNDTWTYLAHDPLFQKDAATTKGIYSSGKGISHFNAKTHESQIFSDYVFPVGGKGMCAHDRHFMVAGGEKQGQCWRVDTKTRTVYSIDPKPVGSSFAATTEHFESCGDGNATLKFNCVYDHALYKRPLFLGTAGEYELHIAVLDKRFHPSISTHRYLINRNRVPVSIRLFDEKIYSFVWPSYEKVDGTPFSFKDLIPQGVNLWIGESQGPLKLYSHDLLESQPGLNKKLIAGETYRVKLTGSHHLVLEAYENVQTNNQNKKES